MKIAAVFINQLNSNMDHSFDYFIPSHLDYIDIGVRIVVPFGIKNKSIDGLVVEIKEKSEFKGLKTIEGVICNYPKLSMWQVEMCFWMQKNYHCYFMEAVSCYIPSNMKYKKVKIDNKIEYLLNNSEQKIKYYKLSGKYSLKEDYLNTTRPNALMQRQVLSCLNDIPTSLEDLKGLTNCTGGTLKSLIEKGLIEECSKVNIRNPYKEKEYSYPENNLNYYQQKSLDAFVEAMEPSTFLIHGVTGSGKTEVFLRLIEETIKKDKGCLYLVPEISLTSQVIERIMGRFKQDIGIIHSKLNAGERIDQWNNIKSKNYNIVLGARSAIFAPMDNIGLIIMDEEHENTYKSSNRPRYNTVGIAKKLQEMHGCHIVLGSATPSVTSYYNAIHNDIHLLELPNRVNDIPMPKIEIVNMKDELYAGNRTVISRALFEGIENNIKSGEQTILFLNKRGYSSFVFCRNCGFVVRCSNCDISMTYHHSSREMLCHYCSHKSMVPSICPKCKSNKIKHTGSGTQKLELQLHKYFPQAKILRMDTDSMQKKGAYDSAIHKFSSGQADILLGTQMVTKGFDFQNVTLVGVILADSTLNIPDFKASERTFQLITQVAGRAGRGTKLGNVVVQTYEPNHYSITLSKNHDYNSFYEKEISYRKMMNYPPFSDIIYIGFTNENEEVVSKDCHKYYNSLLKCLQDNNLHELVKEMFNPTLSPVKKINNRFRWYFIIKTVHIKLYNEIIYNLNLNKDISDISSTKIIDINPNTIL
ncbi:primosomal protein N' [Alkalibaculum sp. M08DMB]|uniref:Replication restart protein PriA n=1 Tax=Alkalibaculum sporogenes TaxID=2655001 RepID=A0A6A7K943_9FIRM|nr:primosomal protein N' [Alkalibaculum sporogenes]MPW26029.1 primosomal protein N' [Alkalibaculum sporogenes]